MRNQVIASALAVVLMMVLAGTASAAGTDYSWWAPATGSWNDSTKWNPTSGWPGGDPGDTAVIAAIGPYTVTLNASPTIAGFTLNSDGAVFYSSGRTLTVNGASQLLDGSVTWRSSTWAGTGTLTNSTDMTIHGSSKIDCGLVQNGDVLIRGCSAGSSATLTVANSFTNSGTMTLDSINTGYTSTLKVSSGTLTNATTGVINTNPGSGGSRNINANLTNNGTVNLNAGTTFYKSGGVYTNNGALNIASGKTLTITGGSQTFNQNGGTLAIDGDFNMTNATFNYNGGTITGTPTLTNMALNIGGGATNAADFLMRGASGTLSGNVHSGQSILIQGCSAASSATLTSANSFTNSGTMTLDSINSGYTSTLKVNSGTLTNTGVINTNPGNGGGRYIYANLTNTGTVNLNTNTTFYRSGGVYTNSGDFNIATGKTLTITGGSQTFNQGGGTLDIDGTFAMTNATFNYDGGTITGTPTLTNMALNIDGGATNAADFLMRGASSTLSGDVHAGQSILIQGCSAASSATLTSANSFTNSGTMTLDSINSAYTSTLTVNSGTLTNAGVINTNTGNGGGRYIYANLTNTGTVNLNASTTFYKSGGVYTNNGAFNIDSNKTLTITGNSQAFNQNGGTLDIDGAFVMTNATFNYNGGTITGTPTLTNMALNIGGGATNAAVFLMRGASSTLSGNVHSGQSILIQGCSAASSATLTSANGFTNSGTMTLDSINSGYTSTLTVNSGTLTNAGIINTNPGAGGGRYIYANLTNAGTVNLNTNTTFYRSGGVYTNSGDFNIATGKTLTITGSTQTFNQDGGTLDIDGTFAMTNATFNYNGGTITGTPTLTHVALNIDGSATNAACFSMRGSGSTLSGNIHAGQTVYVTGSNSGSSATLTAADSFTNSGTIRLSSIDSGYSSTLSLTSGTLTNVGTLDVYTGAGGGRYVYANLTNDGQVNLYKSTTFQKTNGVFINNGDFNVNSGTATFSGTGSTSFTNAAGGRITGVGTLNVSAVDFTNNGTVAPGLSPGTLSFTGTYTQSGSGVLEIEIGDGIQDLLAITGMAILDGFLNVDLYGGYVPVQGDTFNVLTASSGITDNGLVLASEDIDDWLIDYVDGGETLRLEYVPEPASVSLLLLGAVALLRRRR